MEVDIDSIRPSPYQPRLIFDQEDLKQEIKKDRVLSDLVVRNRGEFYEIIDGERRWRAVKELEWKTVPVRVVDADDAKARLSVYKLNKIRKSYTVEEEARYFKKLRDEGMTPLEISKQLNVDSRWVLAHLNVFRFPEDIQKAVWAKQLSMSHIVALEGVVDRNIKEAVLTNNEILNRKLTVAETRKIVEKRARELKARVCGKKIETLEKEKAGLLTEIESLKEKGEARARELENEVTVLRKEVKALETFLNVKEKARNMRAHGSKI